MSPIEDRFSKKVLSHICSYLKVSMQRELRDCEDCLTEFVHVHAKKITAHVNMRVKNQLVFQVGPGPDSNIIRKEAAWCACVVCYFRS